MSVLAAERIKLFSTRSPWWCSALAIAIVVGLTGVLAVTVPAELGPIPFEATRFFLEFGLVVVMVMAAVSVTTEYRFSTIRATFQAVPNRAVPLLAKTAVVALLAGVVGLVASFGAWGTAWLLAPEADLALTTAAHWRAVAGPGLVFAIAAALAIGIGILVRQTAGAVSLVLVWVLLVENLVGAIPNVGTDIQAWLPFVNADNFLATGPAAPGAPFGPWASLSYLAALTATVLTAALLTAHHRDA